MLRFGALRARRELAAPERLREIHDLLAALIEEFSPAAVAVEAPFTALNRKTAQRLAEVRGVVLMTAAESGVPVHSYSPREVKASVTGYGGADKMQMQQMVRATLSLGEVPEPADAADALAVALCHIFCARSSAKLTVSAGNAPGARNRPRGVRIQQGR
jgi:crossover junction endodeoxyribonuclease RuvC